MPKINFTTYQRPICNNNLKDNIHKPAERKKKLAQHGYRRVDKPLNSALHRARRARQHMRSAQQLPAIPNTDTTSLSSRIIRDTTVRDTITPTALGLLTLATVLSSSQAAPMSFTTATPNDNGDIIPISNNYVASRGTTVAPNNGFTHMHFRQSNRPSDIENNAFKQVATRSELHTENKEKTAAINQLNTLFSPCKEQAEKYIAEKKPNINNLINFVSNSLPENIKANIVYKDGNLLIIPETALAETIDTVTGDPIKLKPHAFVSTSLDAHASNTLIEDATAPNNISNFTGLELDSLSAIDEYFHSDFEDSCKVDNKHNKDMEAFVYKVAAININGKSFITILAKFHKFIKDGFWDAQQFEYKYSATMEAFAKSSDLNTLIKNDMQNKNSIHKQPILRGIVTEHVFSMFLLKILTESHLSNVLSYPDALSTKSKDLAAKKFAYNNSVTLINSYKYRRAVREIHLYTHNPYCTNYENDNASTTVNNEDNLADATPMMFELVNLFEKSSGAFNNDAHLKYARELALALTNPIFSDSKNSGTITIEVPEEIHNLKQFADVNKQAEFKITDKDGKQLPILNESKYTLVRGFLAAYVNQCGASNIQVKAYRNGKLEVYNMKVPGFNKNYMSKQGFKELKVKFNTEYRKLASWLLGNNKIEPTVENLYAYAPVVTLDVAKGTVSGEIFGSEYETKLNNIATTDDNTSEAGKLKHLLDYLEKLSSKVSNQVLRVINVSEDFSNSASDPKLKPDFIKTSHKCENFNILFLRHGNNFVSYEVIGKENTNFLKATNILVNTDSTEDNNTSADLVLNKFTIDTYKDNNIAHILTDEFEKNHQVNLKELSPEHKQTILHNNLRKLPLHKIIYHYDKKTGEPKIRANIVAPIIERLHKHGEYNLKNTVNSYLDESYVQQASAILTKLPIKFKIAAEKPKLSLKLTVTDGELRVREATLSSSQQANSDFSKDSKLDMTSSFHVNPIMALNIAAKTGLDVDTYVDIKGNDLLISRNGKPKDAYKLARTNLVNNNIHYELPFTNEDTLPKASSHLRDEL